MADTVPSRPDCPECQFCREAQVLLAHHLHEKGLNPDAIASILGVSAATVTGALAAPAVATGIVGWIGFGAAGIEAGSIAAGMMSSAAIANGGGVAAGSTVAVLQSVGAAGLGSLAGPVMLVGGAAIGGTAAAGALGYSLVKASGWGGTGRTPAASIHDIGDKDWVVATWEGPTGVKFYGFESIGDAVDFFSSLAMPRVLCHPAGPAKARHAVAKKRNWWWGVDNILEAIDRANEGALTSAPEGGAEPIEA